jgi:hypothetical protein
LVSHFSEFSVIFYAIYKVQKFGFTFGVTFLYFGPWKEWKGCNVALSWPAGAAGRNPARPVAVAELERAGEGVGGSRVRFWGLVWVEELPVGALRGTAGRGPPGARLRRVSGQSRKGRRGCGMLQVPRVAGEGLVWCLAGPAGNSPRRPAHGAGGSSPAARPARGETAPPFMGGQGAG